MSDRARPGRDDASLVPPVPRERLDVHANDGTRLNAEVYGRADGPTIVLAHGWTLSLAAWTRQIRELAADFRIVAFDHRGHGASDPAGPAGFTMDAIADDLAAVLDATAPRGRVVLGGHSMGGMTIVALGARRPELFGPRVAAALLVSTGMDQLVVRNRIVPMPLPLAKLAKPISAWVMTVNPGSGGRVDDRFRAATKYVNLGRDATPGEVDLTARIIAACPKPTYRGFARALATMDLDEAVRAFPVPAQVLCGTRDRLTPVWHSRRMAEQLPGSLGLVEIPGAGHMTPLEAPQEVAGALRALAVDHLGPATIDLRDPARPRKEQV